MTATQTPTEAPAQTTATTRTMIIVGSVRPGRIGLPIAEWAQQQLEAAGHEVDLVDLAELNLPFLDEPGHPAKKQYTKPHTIAWSERVEAADAIVLVAPEYNHSYSPALKNAIDFLFHEWNAKPVAIVSYGGISAGLRAATAIEPVLISVGMVRTSADVPISYAGKLIVDGRFPGDERLDSMAAAMAAQLASHAAVLRQLR